MGRDVTVLHPQLQEKITQLKLLCNQQELLLEIGECFRTVKEQDGLYAKGRPTGTIVTNAKGSDYSSQHQWGIAFDFFKNIKGQEYSDAKFFNTVGALAKSIGLGWGGDWKSPVDKPHLYLPDWGSTTEKLKKQYETFEKFKATWQKTNVPIQTTNNQVNQVIMALQKALNADKITDKNGRAVVADGKWGALTESAVEKVLLKVGPNKTMGSKGEIVIWWQERIGFKGKDLDGKFGPGTENRTKEVQKAKGLTADGTVGIKSIKTFL
jgi:hypothetical protein